MPIGIDPQTGQPIALPYDDEGGPAIGVGSVGGAPPALGGPSPALGGPPQQAPPDFLGVVTDAMDLMKSAHELARDEEEAETALKVLFELQKLLTRQQKETRTAVGMSPQQKVLARGG